MSPKTTIMVLLAAAVATVVAFYFVTREDYGDFARQLIERAKKPWHAGLPSA